MTPTSRILLALAALSGALAVVAGAFGAHGVPDPQGWLRTGAQYQMIHVLAVFAAVAAERWGAGRTARVAGWMFLAGGAIFGATLYAMALGAPLWLGAVTPVGGVMLIIGWLLLARGVLGAGKTVA